MALFNEGAHVAVEEGEEEGADVAPVHVGVGQDDDLVVAEALEVKVGLPIPGAADPRPDGGHHGPHLGVFQGLGKPRLLHVEDLAPQGQDGLEAAVPALLGAPPGRVPLHDEELRLLGVFRLAVRQLPGEVVGLQGVLPAHQLPGLPGGLPGLGRP
jgi:hypothetical protein